MSAQNFMRPESFFKLFSSITTLPGIGSRLKGNFTKLGISAPRDLLLNAPINIINRSLIEAVAPEKVSEVVTVIITVVSYLPPGGKGPLRVLVKDSKTEFELVFFSSSF